MEKEVNLLPRFNCMIYQSMSTYQWLEKFSHLYRPFSILTTHSYIIGGAVSWRLHAKDASTVHTSQSDWDEAKRNRHPHARNITLVDPAFVRHVAYTIRQQFFSRLPPHSRTHG